MNVPEKLWKETKCGILHLCPHPRPGPLVWSPTFFLSQQCWWNMQTLYSVKEARHRGHMLYDSIYIIWLEKINPSPETESKLTVGRGYGQGRNRGWSVQIALRDDESLELEVMAVNITNALNSTKWCTVWISHQWRQVGGGEGTEKDQIKDINHRIVERALDLELGDVRLNTLFHLYVLWHKR